MCFKIINNDVSDEVIAINFCKRDGSDDVIAEVNAYVSDLFSPINMCIPHCEISSNNFIKKTLSKFFSLMLF